MEENGIQPDPDLTDGMEHVYVPSDGLIANLDLNKNAQFSDSIQVIDMMVHSEPRFERWCRVPLHIRND
jgi:hypothetical protein